ncbi:MAG TPA: SiaB family protein kinase [Bacteroidales bacterium]|nr:SiaB family protein kinase [Bacteroidales bacterium]
MTTEATGKLNFVSMIRQKMEQNQIMLCYRGEMSQDIIIALLNLTENKLKQSDDDSNLKSRVFGVMVECLQNITHHSEKDFHQKSNMFMIGCSDLGYVIYSGNVIRKDKVDELREKLLEINTMTESELKNLYKYLIQYEPSAGKNEYGLGLIHIARKTGNALDFSFEQIDSDHHFFSLMTLVDH